MSNGNVGVDVQANARDGGGPDVDRRLGSHAIVAVVEPADYGVTTIRPTDDGITGREIGASFSKTRCVRDCM